MKTLNSPPSLFAGLPAAGTAYPSADASGQPLPPGFQPPADPGHVAKRYTRKHDTELHADGDTAPHRWKHGTNQHYLSCYYFKGDFEERVYSTNQNLIKNLNCDIDIAICVIANE